MTPQETLQRWIDEAQRIVFFGGAGVSTESGIPDFRSQDGLYNQKYDYPPETILSHSFFKHHPDVFYRFYRDRVLALDAKPNAAHRKLAELAVAAGIAAEDELPSVVAQRLIDEIRAMNRRMGIPTGFSQIREVDIPTMARHAAREANPLYPVPKLMDAGELEGFYRAVMAKGAPAEQRMPTAAS